MFIAEDKHIGKIEITGHAMNRASTRCSAFYRKYKRKGEGIYDWLVRSTFEALREGTEESNKIQHKGMLFTFVISKDKTKHLKLVTLGLANESTIKKQRKKDRKKR